MSEKISIQKKDLLQLPAPVTERIKTVRDAIEELGYDHPFVILFAEICDNDSTTVSLFESSDLFTYLRLRIVCAALNEGWKPSFTKDEVRWYPWFVRYSAARRARSEERKASRSTFPPDNYVAFYLWASNVDEYRHLDCTDCASSLSNSFIGADLALKSEALANYAGRQFATLWADFYLI